MRIGIVDFSHDIHLKIKEISIRWPDPEFMITRRLIIFGNILKVSIYRLGYFSGTAVETDGMLVYTDDLTDMKGTIRYDSDHAVFEVTQSTSGLAQVGTTWVFPEVKEEF